MKVLLDSTQIQQSIEFLADSIVASVKNGMDIVVIGIRSRGEIIAQRVARGLASKMGKEVPCGTLDITLYRDDLNSPASQEMPQVRSTEISFDINDKVVFLIDDVLYTGRSVRAAMDALVDLGRPRAIRLAVLVERAGREYPIQADLTAYKADVEPEQFVQVRVVEVDGVDEVVVE